jgi:coatomer subunit beta
MRACNQRLQIETDNSARRNSLNMLIQCAPTRAVAFVLANISQLNSLGDIIQIVALELIRKVCKQSPQEKGNYMGAIFDMLSSTSPSVVFQCATTIIQVMGPSVILTGFLLLSCFLILTSCSYRLPPLP